MEVEATGDAVDVEDFASEIEMGHMAAFEGREVDGLQRHAATGDKLIFEGGTAGNLENIVLEDVNQSVNVFFIYFCPAYGRPLPQGLLQQIRPQTLLPTERRIG